MTHYPNIFQPLQVRHRTLDNRIVFGAHTANMSDLGLPGERHSGYYEERARGGAAMIVVEPMPVHATAVMTSAISKKLSRPPNASDRADTSSVKPIP